MEIKLNKKQLENKQIIEKLSSIFNVPTEWAVAIALVESSLGINQLSSTGCKGVFQMSTIAMKDLHQSMLTDDDDLVDITCGLLFLRLLLKRHKDIKLSTAHYCDPEVRENYIKKVFKLMK